MELTELKNKLTRLVKHRDSVKQFSHEWFVAKADIEDIQEKITKIEFVNRQRANPCPDDFVFDVWDDD